MHANLARSSGTAPRRTSLSRLVLVWLCVAGLCALLLQPPSTRGLSKGQTSFQTLFVKDNADKGGKPCQRMVSGAVGTSCSAGAMIALEATTSVVLEPLSSAAGAAPVIDMMLHVQWFGAPQFRPPRNFA